MSVRRSDAVITCRFRLLEIKLSAKHDARKVHIENRLSDTAASSLSHASAQVYERQVDGINSDQTSAGILGAENEQDASGYNHRKSKNVNPTARLPEGGFVAAIKE